MNSSLQCQSLTCVLFTEGQKAIGFNLCSKDEQRFYRFGTTWGWVINYNIFIFVWTIPLRLPADYLQVFYDVDHFSCGVGVGDCSLVSHGPELSECSHQFLEDCIRNVRPILLQHGKLSLRFGVVHCMAAKYVPWKSKSSNHQKYFKQYYIIIVTVLQCFLRSLTLIGQSWHAVVKYF